MSFTLYDNLVTTSEDETGYHSVGFRLMLETHLQHLLARTDTKSVNMTGVEADRFTGDLGGWCIEKGYSEDYHWVIARMNGYASPDAYDGNKTVLSLPALTYIDDLLLRYQSTLS